MAVRRQVCRDQARCSSCPRFERRGHPNRSRPTDPRRGVDDASAVRRSGRHLRSGCAADRRRVHRALSCRRQVCMALCPLRLLSVAGRSASAWRSALARLWSFEWCSCPAQTGRRRRCRRDSSPRSCSPLGIGLSVPGVDARDPSNYAAVAVTIAVVAFFASYLPARRAARIDPLLALRQQRAMVIWDC